MESACKSLVRHSVACDWDGECGSVSVGLHVRSTSLTQADVLPRHPISGNPPAPPSSAPAEREDLLEGIAPPLSNDPNPDVLRRRSSPPPRTPEVDPRPVRLQSASGSLVLFAPGPTRVASIRTDPAGYVAAIRQLTAERRERNGRNSISIYSHGGPPRPTGVWRRMRPAGSARRREPPPMTAVPSDAAKISV